MQTSTTYLVFKVRCCSDAHVLISTTIHKTDAAHAYEFVFGGGSNHWLFLRKGSWIDGQEFEKSAEFPGLVNCDELRTFWLSWEGGLLQAGGGGIPLSHTLLVWQDPNPLDVQYLALSTGMDNTGEWVIRQDQGQLRRRILGLQRNLYIWVEFFTVAI